MNIYYEKQRLRKNIRSRRSLISNQQRKERSERICETVLSLPEYMNSEMLFIYVPLKDEVDTCLLINEALSVSKKVAVPRCRENTLFIDFYYIKSMGELKSGSYSILEPDKNPSKLCCEKNGLCILPGLSFDEKGMRLGYGKGYYDRFLKEFQGTTIGICYDEFLSKELLPAGKFDVATNIIVTETKTLRI